MSTGEPVTCGRTPPPALIQEIAAWVEEREAFRPFSTTSLGAVFPRALPASGVASGLLTFALPGSPQRRLLWFRPEIIKTVNWGAIQPSLSRQIPASAYAPAIRLRSGERR